MKRSIACEVVAECSFATVHGRTLGSPTCSVLSAWPTSGSRATSNVLVQRVVHRGRLGAGVGSVRAARRRGGELGVGRAGRGRRPARSGRAHDVQDERVERGECFARSGAVLP